MGRVQRKFATPDAAEAFVEGIEYANDSAITIDGIEELPDGRFAVVFDDEDRDDDDIDP